MARIALSILWGGLLCGLGYFVLAAWAASSARKGIEDSSGLVVIAIVLFTALLLATMAAADIFNVVDWAWRRK